MLAPTLDIFTIQFISIGILQTLLPETVKRQAEIQDDISPRLLKCFDFSNDNFTINTSPLRCEIGPYNTEYKNFPLFKNRWKAAKM